jgi:hypothetical protein
MSNNPANASSGPQGPQGATARKLIQAAALAAVLVPLGSIAVETAEITCITSQGSGFCQGSGVYSQGSGSNTWKFFTDDSFSTLLYTLEITGNPESSFVLNVMDFVTDQDSLVSSEVLGNFPGAECLPTFDDGLCGLFDVFSDFGEPTWDEDGYYMTITWFTNGDPLSQPPDDGRNHILQAKDGFGGIFTNQLIDTEYDPAPTPTDPALGGRGDQFSRFGAFRTVPEPATLLLLGTGIATAIYRRRRRHP